MVVPIASLFLGEVACYSKRRCSLPIHLHPTTTTTTTTSFPPLLTSGQNKGYFYAPEWGRTTTCQIDRGASLLCAVRCRLCESDAGSAASTDDLKHTALVPQREDSLTTMADQYSMFLTTAPPLRRGSTPLPVKHQLRREEAVSEDCDWIPGLEAPTTLPISDTAVPGDESFSQSAAAQPAYQSHGGALRIVLLGQNGVGKSSLALSLAGQSDRSLSIDSETQACGEGYECTVTVDDEDSKVIIFDNCKQDLSTLQCDVCILVFSVTDRRSFHRTAQLRLLLRESQPQTPIILVGNKSDLVRSREISSEEAQSSAMMFDCIYLELSASLDHGTNELLEAAVRTARLSLIHI